MVHLYRLAHCDTIKKARRWLDLRHINYQFHDFNKEGIDPSLLMNWIEQVGWDSLLNRRGSTWRKVPPSLREACDEVAAVQVMLENPAAIKRPLLVRDDLLEIGFTEARYEALFD